MSCVLCVASDPSVLLWRDAHCRVVDAVEADYPGFCRVVWQAHVREMSDLSHTERAHLLDVVHAVEVALRSVLQPTKINLASLGNRVPHLHWHVIPRFADDAHFPDAVWAVRRRTLGGARTFSRDAFMCAFERALVAPRATG